MPDCLDQALGPLHEEPLQRLHRAAVGNGSSPDGVTLLQASRRDIPVAAVLTVTIAWTTDVETRVGNQMVKAAIYCRNAAELNATLVRDLDTEAASVETARRLATLIGSPEGVFADIDALPGLSSMRGPYYVHEACRSCSGGGVRACTNPACHGGKVECPRCGGTGHHDEDGQQVLCDGGCVGNGVIRCPVCTGAGVVSCDDCAGVGHFTHIHHPRLVATATRGFALPPDAPAAVRALLDEIGFDRFAEIAKVEPDRVRHSGAHLLYERVGTVPVVTLSCACDGLCFEVEAAGPEGFTPDMPCFLDHVLAPVLAHIQAASSTDAFAIAATTRVTKAVADAILTGRDPDIDAIVAVHEHCVSRAFVSQAASALRHAYSTAGLGTVRHVWQRGVVALGLVLLLVAAVDLPAFLSDATPEDAAPLWLRALWDVGLPTATGLGVWLVARHRVQRAFRAAFGNGTRHPTAQGAWSVRVLGSAAALHLGVMVAWHGGLATDRLGDAPEAAMLVSEEAPLPPPRTLSPTERIAAAQRALARLGRYDGPIDGKMGEGTKAGLASLAALGAETKLAGASDTVGLAVAIASDRVGIRLSTPDLLIGPGWSNATRLHLAPGDQPRIEQAFVGAAATPGTPREWTSDDGTRSGILTVTGRIEDPKGQQRLCFAFAHAVITPAGRDAGVPSKACRSAGVWLLDE
ncbi:MAG TPA: hypothetical protein VD978_11550 [Azospirillum sp.]|nr:hypothetical protein [Azospirillum sp.]